MNIDKLPHLSVTLDSPNPIPTNTTSTPNNDISNTHTLSTNSIPQPPRRQGHRHRRSAAISGDFDISDLNSLLPPNNVNNNNGNPTLNLGSNFSKSVPSSLSSSPIRYSMNTFNNSISNALANQELNSGLNSNSNPNKFILTPPISDLNSETFIQLGSPLKRSVNYNNPQSPAFSSHSYNSTRFFMTEDSTFERNSDIPKAPIDLDDIFNNNSQSVNSKKSFMNMNNNGININYNNNSFMFNSNGSGSLPKHSVLCSPKKAEMMFVEDIEEENEEEYENENENENELEIENSSLNSSNHSTNLHIKNNLLFNNSSQNSLNSLNSNNSGGNGFQNDLNSSSHPVGGSSTLFKSNGMSKLNTSSVSNLRNTVRYQQYNSPTSTNSTLSTFTSSSSTNTNITQESTLTPTQQYQIRPTSRSNFLSAPNNSNNHHNSRSPVRSSYNSNIRQKKLQHTPQINPFQFESVSYEIPKNFHKDNDVEFANSSQTQTLNTSLPPPSAHHRQRSSISNSITDALSRSRSNSPSKRTFFNDGSSAAMKSNKSSKSISSIPLNQHRHSYSSTNSTSSTIIPSPNPNLSSSSFSHSRSQSHSRSSLSTSQQPLPQQQQQQQQQQQPHRRTSSLFSTISNKFSSISHHRRRSSVISTTSTSSASIATSAFASATESPIKQQRQKQHTHSHSHSRTHSKANSIALSISSHSDSIIAKTTSDELINIHSPNTFSMDDIDDTLHSDMETTLMEIGEPGPMIPIHLNMSKTVLQDTTNTSRSNSNDTNITIDNANVVQQVVDNKERDTINNRVKVDEKDKDKKKKGHFRRSSLKSKNKIFGFFHHSNNTPTQSTNTSNHSHSRSNSHHNSIISPSSSVTTASTISDLTN